MEISQAISQILTFPMIAQRRLVIIKHADRLPDSATRELLPVIESPPETTVLVITANKPDGRKKLFSELRKRATAVEFRTPYDNEIPAWIQTRVKTLGRQIEPKAAHQLQMSVGSNLRELNTEIEKLFIATTADTITHQHVVEVIDNTRGVTIFELADALGHRRLGRAQTLIDRLREQGEHPVGMVALLVRHFTILRRARWIGAQRLSGQEVASRLKVPSFFAKNYLEQARNFDEQALWAAYNALLDADNRLKSSSGPPYQILADLAYRLCTPLP
jgi:DNA polymerase-3 subunit delta